MIFFTLNAVCAKAPPFAVPVPVFGAGAFVCGPVAGQLPGVPSAITGGAYVLLQLSAASVIWDAITVGYGRLGAVALLTGGNLPAARRVRQFAASRARLLRTIYEWPPGGAPGPQLTAEYEFVESSERRVVSFLIGQTVAQTQAKLIWGVRRLFHRSLYGPILPLLFPGMQALQPGQSPDYLCLAPAPPGAPIAGIGLVEAKGTNSLFNPEAYAADRNKLDRAFAQLGGIAVAWQSAVSVAGFDAALPANVIVGQFWDPRNPNAHPVSADGAAAITAEYFRRLFAFLTCLEPPVTDGKRQVWIARSIGFRIAVSLQQWNLLTQLSENQITDGDFYTQISWLLPADNAPPMRLVEANAPFLNGDGLELELVEFA